MRKQWRYFLLALGFFTRIPVPNFVNFQESDLNHSTKYFPLIGLIVGLVSAIVFYISALIFPQTIAVLMSMASTIYLTGAFHEDGLADSADGLGGGWQREQILTIMQDSRLGTYGAVALFLMLFAKFQVLAVLHTHWDILGLIAAHALSRLCAVWLIASLPYAKPSGKAKPLSTQISGSGLIWANFFGLLPTLILLLLMYIATDGYWKITLVFVALLALLIAIIWWWWRRLLLRRLGGYTGDTLGAMQQMTELAFYIAALSWERMLSLNWLNF